MAGESIHDTCPPTTEFFLDKAKSKLSGRFLKHPELFSEFSMGGWAQHDN